MRLLIAESGSTKTDWVLLRNGVKVFDFQSKGINPYVHSPSEITNILTEVKGKLDENLLPETIFFYGAGCSRPAMVKIVEDAFRTAGFQNIALQVFHDLLAAAHALFQGNDGIACILGTGSSSALCLRGKIIDQIPALGYVLGDEGGGVDLGKRLLLSIFKRDAPEQIRKIFEEKYNLKAEEVLNKIYFDQSPNRFLASFAVFISENLNDDYLHQLVLDSFRSFVSLNVVKYKDSGDLPVGFVGSVAFNFKDLMLEVLKEYNLTPGLFLKSPIQGLLQYHGIYLP